MRLRREPVVIQAAVLAALNLIAAFGVVDLSPGQLGAANAAVAAALGLITRQAVTPVGDPHGPGGERLVPAEPPRAPGLEPR